LDIPTCSYVIRYEFVSDEIGTIQSRGRARAQNSSYYLITEHGSINHRREENNKTREENMEIAITEWPDIDKDKFREDVKTNTVNNYTNFSNIIEINFAHRINRLVIGKKR
jgi:ATP-dependent RNA helicase DDX58